MNTPDEELRSAEYSRIAAQEYLDQEYTITITESKIVEYIVTADCYGDALDLAWHQVDGKVLSHTFSNLNIARSGK